MIKTINLYIDGKYYRSTKKARSLSEAERDTARELAIPVTKIHAEYNRAFWPLFWPLFKLVTYQVFKVAISLLIAVILSIVIKDHLGKPPPD